MSLINIAPYYYNLDDGKREYDTLQVSGRDHGTQPIYPGRRISIYGDFLNQKLDVRDYVKVTYTVTGGSVSGVQKGTSTVTVGSDTSERDYFHSAISINALGMPTGVTYQAYWKIDKVELYRRYEEGGELVLIDDSVPFDPSSNTTSFYIRPLEYSVGQGNVILYGGASNAEASISIVAGGSRSYEEDVYITISIEGPATWPEFTPRQVTLRHEISKTSNSESYRMSVPEYVASNGEYNRFYVRIVSVTRGVVTNDRAEKYFFGKY